MADLIGFIIRMNLVASLAILAVILVRPVVRRVYGAEIAYALWIIPLAAAGATLVPTRVVTGPMEPPDLVAPGMAIILLGVWLAGVIVLASRIALLQARFLRLARSGKAGPAVVGVFMPRLLMPPDDGAYSQEERALVKAHEREHIARGDHKANAFLALAQCLAWFNPLVHLAVHLARLDQELACDAAVIGSRGSARAAYARALLKTQMSGEPLPLGASWSPQAAHPLELRVALLAQPTRVDVMTGQVLVAVTAFVVALAAWTVQPPITRAPRLVLENVREGPPCPIVTPTPGVTTRLPRTVDFQGVRFARKFGDANCVSMEDGGVFGRQLYHVCQFGSPGRIGVTAGDRTIVFAPGPAQRATVKIHDGELACALGGWFPPLKS
jgi:beta-lactamase regulating signal transducer with metallopeptidase domain